MIIINTVPAPPPKVIVNFGWYSGTPPFRPPEYVYTTNGHHYPPGMTTLTSTCSSPMTNGVLNVDSTTSFDLDTIASVVVHDGTNWSLFTYEDAVGDMFTGCNSQAPGHTFAPGSVVWDPRFYVDQAPLHVVVTFDALDTVDMALDKTYVPDGIEVVEWLWDFGNGETGSGPVATTTYPFSQAPPTVRVSLDTLDNLERHSSASFALYLSGGIVPPPPPPIPGSNPGGGILYGGSVVEHFIPPTPGFWNFGGSVVESYEPFSAELFAANASGSGHGSLAAWAVHSDGSLSLSGTSTDEPLNTMVALVPSGGLYAYMSGTTGLGSSSNVYNFTIGSGGVLTPIVSQASITLPALLGSIQTVTPDRSTMLFPCSPTTWGVDMIAAYLINLGTGALTAAGTYSNPSIGIYGSTSGSIAVASDNHTIYLYNSYRATVTCLTMAAGAASFSVNYIVARPGAPAAGMPSLLHISADDKILVGSDNGRYVWSFNTATQLFVDQIDVGAGNSVSWSWLDSANHVYIQDNVNVLHAYNVNSTGTFSLINTYSSISNCIAESGSAVYALCVSNGNNETSYTLAGVPTASNTQAMPSSSQWITVV